MVTKFTHFEKLVCRPEVQRSDKLEISLNAKGDHFVIRFINSYQGKDEDGNPRTFACSPSAAARRYQQRFLEVQHLTSSYPAERISVPVVDTSAIIISAWPAGQIHWDMKAMKKCVALNYRVALQRKAAELVAKYKEEKIYENGVFTISEKVPLATYQKVALHASSTAVHYGLFMEQGTGKTAPTIARICNEAEKYYEETGKHYRAVVICPKNVKYNWKCEIAKFATCKGTVHIIGGPDIERQKQLVSALCAPKPADERFTVLVMNYETVLTILEPLKMCAAILSQTEKDFDFKTSPVFHLGILDESHYIKTPGAKRSKSALDLRDRCQQRMVLTGTPITNHPFDLYMQLEFLEKGMSGFSSFSAFKNFFGVFEPGGMGYEKLVDLQNIPILQERLSRCSFQIRKTEALPDLPDKLYDQYEVEMTAEQCELYKQIATELVTEIEMEQNQGTVKKEFMTNHILTKLLRLAQVCSGFVGFPERRDELTNEVTEERSEYVLDKNPKLDALVEILKSKDDSQKTIVWCCFVQDIRNVAARLTAEGIKFVKFYGATSEKQRNIAVERFNGDPEVKVFLGNPEAASTGLNLIGYPPGDESYETNCDHAIFFSQNWKPAPRIQAEDRCHRRGTRQPVRITNLVVPSTIDTEIRERVEKKRELAEDVSDVSDILSSIMSSLKSLY